MTDKNKYVRVEASDIREVTALLDYINDILLKQVSIGALNKVSYNNRDSLHVAMLINKLLIRLEKAECDIPAKFIKENKF